MGTQEVSFRWDVSLRAVLNKGVQNNSTWLRDASKDMVRTNTGETDHKKRDNYALNGSSLIGTIGENRGLTKTCEGIAKHKLEAYFQLKNILLDELLKDGTEDLDEEDNLVGMIEGKKRQRVTRMGQIRNSPMEIEFPKDGSTACKPADRS